MSVLFALLFQSTPDLPIMDWNLKKAFISYREERDSFYDDVRTSLSSNVKTLGIFREVVMGETSMNETWMQFLLLKLVGQRTDQRFIWNSVLYTVWQRFQTWITNLSRSKLSASRYNLKTNGIKLFQVMKIIHRPHNWFFTMWVFLKIPTKACLAGYQASIS